MSDITETKAATPRRASSGPARWTAETWAVVLSVAFIALIVAGVFPRVPW
ncbi:MAG: hypothetical protein JO000_08620 [Alphaproteobacteria bacterium]|nr:hypothetical protein [Alphaproteobacteria bacterium]